MIIGKRIFAGILLVLMCVLSGCGIISRSMSLEVCGSYAVPGMFCFDLKGNNCSVEELETDDYGRILFEYTTDNVITKQEETTLVVCQKIDADRVWFYEDVCYAFSDSTRQDMEALKTANDWGLPLNSSKMAHRAIKVSFDLFLFRDSELETDRIETAFDEALQRDYGNDLSACYFLDLDQTGMELYYIEPRFGNESVAYLAIVDSAYKVVLAETEAGRIDQAGIHSFKQQNGWEP